MEIIPLLTVTTKVLVLDLHQPMQGISYGPDMTLVSYGTQYAPEMERYKCCANCNDVPCISIWAYCSVPGLAKGTGTSFCTETYNIGYNPLRSALT